MAASAKEQTEIAAAFVRIYVFLAQYLDRCFDADPPLGWQAWRATPADPWRRNPRGG